METPNKIVYHGSPKEFDSKEAVPKRNRRIKHAEDGTEQVIFDQESFHATPHKWIALAYTYNRTPFKIEGMSGLYNMGVSLYEDRKEVNVFGVGSLEESLKALYGNGGYLYHFDGDKFVYTEGLGRLEVIATTPTKPITVEHIDDPVEEMKKLSVTFRFFDLSLPENEAFLN